MPQPNAVISVPTSSEEIILSKRAFSTFKILPFNGKIACVRRSRPCLAEPPAESPSTKNSSERAGSFSWQSANFPGRPAISNVVLRRVISRALRAASLALAASIILPTIVLAICGFSNKNSCSFSFIVDSTSGFTSEDTSLSLVCEENFGSGTLTDNTAVSPSRASSPVVDTFSFFAAPLDSMYWLIVRVNAPLKPAK